MARPSATAVFLLLLLSLAVARCGAQESDASTAETANIMVADETGPPKPIDVPAQPQAAGASESELAVLPEEQDGFLRQPSHRAEDVEVKPVAEPDPDRSSMKLPESDGEKDGHRRHHHEHEDEEEDHEEEGTAAVKRLRHHHHDEEEKDEEKEKKTRKQFHSHHHNHEEDKISKPFHFHHHADDSDDEEDDDLEEMVRLFRKAILRRRFGHHGRRFFRHHHHGHHHHEEGGGVMMWIKGLVNRF